MRRLLPALLCTQLVWAADCPAPAPRAVTLPDTGWSLATQNLWQLHDDQRHGRADRVVPAPLLDARLDRLADHVVHTLAAPTVLAVQEVEHLGLLEALADRIRARGGPAYSAVLREGHDVSGIDVGVLVRAPVQVSAVRQLAADEKHGQHALFSRPPLWLSLSAPWTVELLVVHQRSGHGLSDARKGERVRDKRARQAGVLAQWASAQLAAGKSVILAGDFNSDGDDDLFGAPLRQVLATGLQSAWLKLPSDERYSYIYRCERQALDHVLMSADLFSALQVVAVSRGNAGHFRVLHDSQGTEVVSDHDGLVISLPLGQ